MMTLDEYVHGGQALYGDFAQVVENILKAAIGPDSLLRVQAIQNRAKEPSSLQKKLAKNAENNDNIVAYAKDLAGVRIIFYTNSDVIKFENSGILNENFDIDWQRTKIHYPNASSDGSGQRYIANNFVVSLKSNRTDLPKFQRFLGLLCEVQMQTVLNHAWSEVEHDIIYKGQEIAGFGAEQRNGIVTRLRDIMDKYLLPAGHEFDKVVRDFERLKQGQELFADGVVAQFDACMELNELNETFERISNSVLRYVDDRKAFVGDVFPSVVTAVKRARDWPVIPHETPFGNYRGNTLEDVAKSAAAIVSDLRYEQVETTFDLLCDICKNATNDEREIWIGVAEELAEHSISIWRTQGPIVQAIIVERIVALSDTEKLASKPIVLAMLGKVLESEVTGTSAPTYDSISLERGAVTASDGLIRIRDAAIGVLKFHFQKARDDEERREIIGKFSVAMQLPHPVGTIAPALTEMIFNNAADIVDIYTRCVTRWSFELRQSVEHSLLWKYRNYCVSERSAESVAPELPARARLSAAILSFRDVANSDDGFVTYKVLVGYDSVFPPAWDDTEFDHEKEEIYRNTAMTELVAGIGPHNADHWLEIIKSCAATQSNDLATFPSFTNFLEQLAKAQPEVALDYLGKLDERLANFMTALVLGLAKTNRWPETLGKFEHWIADKQFLSDIAFACGRVEAIGLQVLSSALNASISMSDVNAVRNCIMAIANRISGDNIEPLKEMYFQASIWLTGQDDPSWPCYWWQSSKARIFFGSFDTDEIVKLLDATLACSHVNHHFESMLAYFAGKHPAIVIEYFGGRQAWKNAGTLPNYETIPYSLSTLGPVLAVRHIELCRAVRIWFANEPGLFTYRGGRLIREVFPNFSNELEAELLAFVRTENLDDLEFVVSVLRSYSGQSFIQPLCKEIVAILAQDDQLLGTVEISILMTGETNGEFGQVEALQRKHAEISDWANDNRQSVRAFAPRFLQILKNSIAAETRRAEQEIAQRQLNFVARDSGERTDD